LIEFQLEDNISDIEALKLIQNSYNNKLKESPKGHRNSKNINTLILDEEIQDQSVDPFTYKLMDFEVKLLCIEKRVIINLINKNVATKYIYNLFNLLNHKVSRTQYNVMTV